MAGKVQCIRLPGLSYCKIVDVDATKVTTTYINMASDHFDTIASIAYNLADAGIGPWVYDVGRKDKESWITVERVYNIQELVDHDENGNRVPKNVLTMISSLVSMLHDMGICHGDLQENIFQNSKGNYVVIDLDQSFYIGKGNVTRLNAYAHNRGKPKSRQELENEYIQNDINVIYSYAS